MNGVVICRAIGHLNLEGEAVLPFAQLGTVGRNGVGFRCLSCRERGFTGRRFCGGGGRVLAACTGSQDPTTPSTEAPTSEAALSTGEATEPNAIPADGSELGEGQHSFTFQVQMADGTAYHYTVHTDEETVGAALVALGLIEGEEGSYGLYVTTVLGTTSSWTWLGHLVSGLWQPTIALLTLAFALPPVLNTLSCRLL